MRVLRPDDPAPDDASGAIYAIGNFDGLHRGHQALFAAAIGEAKKRGVKSGVLTFSPHPAKILSPQLAPQLLLNDAEKERGIERAGIDVLAIERFDATLAKLSPTE